jgi:hypothetical protein
MKKTLLVLALIVTTCNFAIGLSYAAVCQGAGGARACGKGCVSVNGDQCMCEGSCTQQELDWVAGAHSRGAEEEVVYDY